jgi:hypothetical protein
MLVEPAIERRLLRCIDIRRPKIATLDRDLALPIRRSCPERALEKIAQAARLAGCGDDLVVGLVPLQHQPRVGDSRR